MIKKAFSWIAYFVGVYLIVSLAESFKDYLQLFIGFIMAIVGHNRIENIRYQERVIRMVNECDRERED